MEQLKMSLITVTFNSQPTLRDTIESVKQQTYKNIEYIIIDGNSSDQTVEIVKQYSQSLQIKWISEKDNGLYDAMNKGIALATGDYVGILNSDDTFYKKETIEEIANFLNENKEIDAIIGNIVQHDGKRVVRQYSSKNWNPEKLKIGSMPPHPSIFFKRQLFEHLGNYNLKYPISADYELITRFFLKHGISYKYSGITTTSMLRGGASSSGFKSYNRITKQILSLLQDHNIAHNPLKIKFRIFWKIFELLKR